MTPFALEWNSVLANKSEDSFGTALLKGHDLKTEKKIFYSMVS